MCVDQTNKAFIIGSIMKPKVTDIMRSHPPVFLKCSSSCSFVTEYGRLPTKRTYFWGRSLDGLGVVGLSSDWGSVFAGLILLVLVTCLASPGDALGFFLVLVWFKALGLVTSSCVMILVSVYIAGLTVRVLFLRPKISFSSLIQFVYR